MKKQINIDGITALTNDLSEVYSELRAGNMKRHEARAIHGVACVIIRSAIAKALYYKYNDIEKKIPFLEN